MQPTIPIQKLWIIILDEFIPTNFKQDSFYT